MSGVYAACLFNAGTNITSPPKTEMSYHRVRDPSTNPTCATADATNEASMFGQVEYGSHVRVWLGWWCACSVPR